MFSLFQQLESRVQMSVSFEMGYDQLTIKGNSANDTISVIARPDPLDGTMVSLKVTAGSQKLTLRRGAAPRYVYIDSGGGQDKITIDASAVMRKVDVYDALTGQFSYSYYESAMRINANGGSGADSFTVNAEGISVFANGGGSNDTLRVGDASTGDSWDVNLNGGTGNDTLIGNDSNDQLNGGPGNDKLYGLDGDDWLNGEDGNDTLYGGDGNDGLHGGLGADRVYGEAGDDYIYSGLQQMVYQGPYVNESIGDKLDGGSGDDEALFDNYYDLNAVAQYASSVNVELFTIGGGKG